MGKPPGDFVDLQVPPTGLPSELLYFYLVAPILMAPVFRGDLFELPPLGILRSVASHYVPFLSIPAGIHLVYRFLMPRLVRPVPSLRGRALVHVCVNALVAAVVGLLIRPVFLLFAGTGLPTATFVVTCVVISWMFVAPALVMQELHNRAVAVERRLGDERQATLRAQLEALQSRTHPHFLFNALNTIASLVRRQPELAERTVERLADLLRYALQSSRLSEVPLGRELEMIQDYLEVQKARFGERLRFQMDVEPGLEHVRVPPLLLQPLVENAVLHGIASRAEGGLIRIVVRSRAGRVQMEVDDNGLGPGGSNHQGNGTALNDLRRRLDLLYGNASGLLIRSSDLGGFHVEFGVPREGRP